MNYTMHVVSHTHWDREFYLPFQEFRIRLVEVMDKLLGLLDRDPDFLYFLLDGQTIMLQDYLEIKPENRERIKKYVRQGRLLVGPKYQLNDHFLVSGEAHIRNFIIGIRESEEFGGVMRVGYCADEFGLISQYPQILRGFGIDNAIFGRGIYIYDDRKMECIWESPDGSQVLGSIMAMWFNNAQYVPVDPAEADDMIKNIKNFMGHMAATPHLLLMNGVDQLEAQQNLSEAMRGLSERLEGDVLIHSTLPMYIEAVRDYVREAGINLKVFKGELREDKFGHILAGTLSTRMYLKQQNDAAQAGLERYAEPASAVSWMLGAEYPSGALDYAWKLLMQNHPHDSICGCSCDEVHVEMEVRSQQVQQVADTLTGRAIDRLVSQIKTDSETLIVFNPLSWKRTDMVRANVDFPLNEPFRGEAVIDPTRDVPAFELYDADDKAVPFAVLGIEQTMRQILDTSKLTHGQSIKRFVIEFIAEDVPACGYKTYRIVPKDTMPKSEGASLYKDGVLSNGLLTVRFEGGSMSVEHVETDRVYKNLNSFEDVGDVGDEYRYFKPKNDKSIISSTKDAKLSVVCNSPVSATLKIEQTLMLPESVVEEYSGRSEKLVPCPITSYVTMRRGIPRVDIRTEIENNAKDHRLRAHFPTSIKTDFSHAESIFDVITRPIRIPEDWDRSLCSTFHPQLNWVDVNDGKSGFCLINKGLPEYELYDDADRTLALTLLRCVGNLAGRDVAHVNKLTPGAQCLGKHTFEYSICPHAGIWKDAQVWIQAYQHNVPFYVRQTGAHDGALPTEASFVEIEPSELIVTAVKKAEKDDRLIVRFFNTTDDIVDGKITVRGVKSAEITNMNEEPEKKLQIAGDGSVRLKVTGKKIITLGFKF